MTKDAIQSKDGAFPGGAYSQGWRVGDFIFVTCPIDTIEQQTEQVIDNLIAILAVDGASLLDAVKISVHLNDTRLFASYNAVYARRFSKPYPVRTTVGRDLGNTPGMLIEIDCIAYAAKRKSKKQSRTSKRKAA